MATVVYIPIVAIVIIVVIILSLLMRLRRQRQRNRTVSIPPRNPVVPMQPTHPNFRMPMQPTQPIPSMPLTQPIPSHSPNVVNPPMPVPQPFFPTTTFPNPSTPPQPTESDLMERMRQVQMLMVEIHRLESESGERNGQRVQELKQRVMELSNTDGHDHVHIPSDPVQPPPAYPSHENNSMKRPEYGYGSG